MVLEGVVTNVAAFGAFVDVGVHQDGLVHVSAMSRDFVSDPREVAKPGDVVRVRVLSVDIPRKRIALSMRLDDEPAGQTGRDRPRRDEPGRDQTAGGTGLAAPDQAGRDRPRQNAAPRPPGGISRRAGGAMADALRRAGLAGRPAGKPRPPDPLAGLPAVRAAEDRRPADPRAGRGRRCPG